MSALALPLARSRNSFHPAWLLLPLPALAWFLAAAAGYAETPPLAVPLQFVVGLAMAAPWVWWRAGKAPPRAVQWLKEARALMPGALLATLGPALAAVSDEFWPLLLGCFPVGIVLMAATAFSGEFENRTAGAYLCLPRTRGQLFLQKAGVLAVFLVLSTLHAAASVAILGTARLDAKEILEWLGVLLVLVVSAPLYALALRNTIAAITLAIGVPLALYTPVLFVFDLWWTRAHRGEASAVVAEYDAQLVLTVVLAALYTPVTAFLAWRRFQRLESIDAAQATAAPVLVRLGRPAELAASLLGRGPVAALVRKEIRLHTVPWLGAPLMAVIAVLIVVARGAGLFERDPEFAFVGVLFMGMAAVATLIGTGATCVAEERQVGTHDGQLALPASIAAQWRAKVLVTLAAGLAAGVAWPLALLRLVLTGKEFAALHLSVPDLATVGFLSIACGSAATLLLAVGIYASSASRTTLKAGTATIGLALAILLLAGFELVHVVRLFSQHETNPGAEVLAGPVDAMAWNLSKGGFLGVVLGIVAAAMLAWTLGMLALARRNFRRTSVPAATLRGQWVLIAAGTALVILTAGVATFTLAERVENARSAAMWRDLARQTEASLRRLESRGGIPANFAAAAAVPAGTTPGDLAVALLRKFGGSAANWAATGEVPNHALPKALQKPEPKRYPVVLPRGYDVRPTP